MTRICPHCGYNFAADEPLTSGDWFIHPRDGAFYKGALVTRRVPWVQILLMLASLNGDRVTADALLNRISDSDSVNIASVQVCQLRRHLKQQGIPDPIESERGRGHCGYRWRVQEVRRAA